jgi:hypothetical protein
MKATYLEPEAFNGAFNSADNYLQVNEEFNFKSFLELACSEKYNYQFYFNKIDGYYVLGWLKN